MRFVQIFIKIGIFTSVDVNKTQGFAHLDPFFEQNGNLWGGVQDTPAVCKVTS